MRMDSNEFFLFFRKEFGGTHNDGNGTVCV